MAKEKRYEYRFLGSKKHKAIAMLLCLVGGFLGLHYFYVNRPWRGAVNVVLSIMLAFASGYFAARMLMLIASKEKEVMFFKLTQNGHSSSKQQDNREVGFRHYMRDHFPEIKIIELDVPWGGTKQEYTTALTAFFDEHPDVHHCITLSSKAHIVGDFLLKSNRRDIQIMGYDMVEKNAHCLKEGSISFLIAQHAYQQGYCCIDALFKAIVLKKKVQPVNYMPIELLSPENVDFYRRTQL